MPALPQPVIDPLAERRTRRADRRVQERAVQYRSIERRTLTPDRRDAFDTVEDAQAALTRIETECHHIDVAAAHAEAAWNRASADYEKAEAVWSQIRADRSRKRAALIKLQVRVGELQRA